MKISIEEFNRKYPIGTELVYLPIRGQYENCKIVIVESEAYEMYGMPMVQCSTVGGGACIFNLEEKPGIAAS